MDTSNFVPPVDGQPYSPSSCFGTNKAVAPGLYCVYNGASGNPFKLSRLKKSTVYYLQIFEYNKAPKPVYLRSLTSGNYDSFSTTYITAALSSPNFECYQKDSVYQYTNLSTTNNPSNMSFHWSTSDTNAFSRDFAVKHKLQAYAEVRLVALAGNCVDTLIVRDTLTIPWDVDFELEIKYSTVFLLHVVQLIGS